MYINRYTGGDTFYPLSLCIGTERCLYPNLHSSIGVWSLHKLGGWASSSVVFQLDGNSVVFPLVAAVCISDAHS